MNLANHCELEGTIHGDCWTRWKSRERGQVRFWLAISRELAGDGFDLVLCAIEPSTADEVYRLERELLNGRTVKLEAQARTTHAHAVEESPGVIFVAECAGLDGRAPGDAHRLGVQRRPHAHGKMAAAGDVELLPLEGIR